MLKPIRLAAVLFILIALLPATSSPSFLASAAPHALGISPTLVAAATYSILAGSIVTNTGPTTVAGDLGVSPSIGVPPHVTGFPPGIVGPPGAIHDADAHAAAAQADNTVAFGFLDQPCDVTYGGVQDLTAVSPLVPGVYCATAFTLSGNLTLTGSGVWIFKSASTLITSPGSSVTGGDPCNVWWRVVSSATLDTNTAFIGNILALTSIGMNTGATLNGRALAQTGAVTMDTSAISLVCAAAPNPSQIIVDKVTTPAGSSVSFDFGLTGGEPQVNVPFNLTDAAAPFESANLDAGTYQVTETVPTDWELSASCTTDSATPDDPTDDVTFDYANGADLPLASGETIRCTFTNTAGPTSVQLADFSGVVKPDHVLLTWETVSEINNLGFNIYRSDAADGAQSLISATMIPANNPGTTQGSAYSFQDSDVQPGVSYYYWLEDLDTAGQTNKSGPVAVTFLGPTSVGLNSFTAVAGTAPALLGLGGAAMAALAGLAIARRKQD